MNLTLVYVIVTRAIPSLGSEWEQKPLLLTVYLRGRMLSRMQYHRFMTYPCAMLLPVRNACTKLFVGGLSYDTNETVLRDAFIRHGEIIEVRVICHHVSGKSKGYGFVKCASEDAAASALKQMDGQVSSSSSFGLLQDSLSTVTHRRMLAIAFDRDH
ncbi:hypothetical protein Cgig2_009256 [Carnegiea gigantea]|uniref:RRM domain-containing protein n=1 Tax=Carnegiea gigantea TaxID=171969 RepID=A0A9Q1QAH2_9CARY|nr:hypothetical protein Cgig2_009256 [Carnegiea gigantea]